MSKSVEVVILPEGHEHRQRPACHEDGVEVPLERIAPDVLRNLIAEFVTREWEELGNSCHTLDNKILQVHQQLRDKQAKVVFDLGTNTCNIVPSKG